MAINTISSSFPRLFLVCALACLCSLKALGFASEGRETIEKNLLHHTHTVQVSSLLPSTICTPSTKGPHRKGSLKVVHKNGPCSQLNQDKTKIPTDVEILEQDQLRAEFIQYSRHSKRLGGKVLRRKSESKGSANIPANLGRSFRTNNYIVTVGLGTPKRSLTLAFDTGSDLTWTQCQPCAGSCYDQDDVIFNPSHSSTYTNITCSSPLCSQLLSATGNRPACSSSTCVYGVLYGDRSFSLGFFGKEKLTLTDKDVFQNFLFGCGQDNEGLFGAIAGLLGLGRDKFSLVEQTANRYGRIFSYCLPSTSSSTGHLTFGEGSDKASKAIKFSPFSKSYSKSSFYGLDLLGIRVAGNKLAIPPSVFSTAGLVIDSGTTLTYLPPTVYNALRTAFRQAMKNYTMGEPFSILDTCYDFSSRKTIYIPRIVFSFSGGVDVEVDKSGVLLVRNLSQVCLAFTGNKNANDTAIFGNTQQKTLEVVYDVGRSRIGFAPGGC
ncbi:hypothetical protein I3842_07G233900 [Carya illinoinensis]|uniref:Peptidase A1 domain-containing protein n=1 Tax=Carya illinoinensis TaxID=32201 RepID=A0A922JGQ4_CARIL|nr:hypothetical protein I3842_07G233900 [Carya illinoinensis]